MIPALKKLRSGAFDRESATSGEAGGLRWREPLKAVKETLNKAAVFIFREADGFCSSIGLQNAAARSVLAGVLVTDYEFPLK